MRPRRISSWDEIQLEDLFAAFRKAKADCFFERSAYVAEQFAVYENGLFENLQVLLGRLRAGEVSAVLVEAQRNPGVFAKGVTLRPRGGATGGDRESLAAIQEALRSGDPVEAERLVQAALDEEEIALPAHAFFSDADRAFERLKAAFEVVPEFRLVGDFDVNTHVVSGLWINCIGHQFDAKLSRHAFGSRVRRYAADRTAGQKVGAYQYEAVGTFEPYFQPYRRWRDEGIKSIDDALKNEDSVVALTLDFSSYYHSIDPDFMLDERFKSAIGLELNGWESDFTKDFINTIQQWGATAASVIGAQDLAAPQIGGIPIGLAAVRIITNVLLYEMDRAIVDALHPIYYGRYVDDVFLVIKDSGRIKSTEQLWLYISSCLPNMFRVSGEEVEVCLPGNYQGETKLRLKPEKQRVFFLRGQAGRDLLSNI
ncbi:MAG: RNA-directed DNA polymerase, partial [Alphaproteobacteria bacterium]